MDLEKTLTRCFAYTTAWLMVGGGTWLAAESGAPSESEPLTVSLSDRRDGHDDSRPLMPRVSDRAVFKWLIRGVESAPASPKVESRGEPSPSGTGLKATTRRTGSREGAVRRLPATNRETRQASFAEFLATTETEAAPGQEQRPVSQEEVPSGRRTDRESGGPPPLRSQAELFGNLWGKPLRDEASEPGRVMEAPSEDSYPFERPLESGVPLGSAVRTVPDAEWGERGIVSSVYTWSAPHFYHHPLYFEQVNLERYGQGPAACLQPISSAAHFFGTVPLLPYHLGAAPPSERDYVLGHRRPGSYSPYQWHRTRFSWRGVAYQGLATAGAAIALP